MAEGTSLYALASAAARAVPSRTWAGWQRQAGSLARRCWRERKGSHRQQRSLDKWLACLVQSQARAVTDASPSVTLRALGVCAGVLGCGQSAALHTERGSLLSHLWLQRISLVRRCSKVSE